MEVLKIYCPKDFDPYYPSNAYHWMAGNFYHEDDANDEYDAAWFCIDRLVHQFGCTTEWIKIPDDTNCVCEICGETFVPFFVIDNFAQNFAEGRDHICCESIEYSNYA